MVEYFADPRIGVVQGRWTWVNRHYSNLSEVEAILLDGHFVIEHGGRNFSGRFFNFNGTAGMWRRAAIEDAGGWQHDTLTEDTDLSYRAQLKGWKFVYDPNIECPSELPVEMNSFKTQQARWAKGLIQVAKKLLPRIWRSRQPLHIKLEATFHLTANIAYPLMVVFSVILLPAMIVRFYQGWFQMLYLDLPMFLASTCSVSSFYMVAQRELYPKDWWKRIRFMPFLMATGIGLSVTNSMAVIEALLGKRSEFVRTPKYRVELKEEGWEQKKYVRRGGGWTALRRAGPGGLFRFRYRVRISGRELPDGAFSAALPHRLRLYGHHVAFPDAPAPALEYPARLWPIASRFTRDIVPYQLQALSFRAFRRHPEPLRLSF